MLVAPEAGRHEFKAGLEDLERPVEVLLGGGGGGLQVTGDVFLKSHLVDKTLCFSVSDHPGGLRWCMHCYQLSHAPNMVPAPL